MRQFYYGLALLLFLALPPVRHLMESIMAMHMHMQMMLLFVSGLLMAPFIQKKIPGLFAKFNKTGYPGLLLFLIILFYWMLPRTMDESLEIWSVELFKFISLPFLAGVPLRDSWPKLREAAQVSFFLILGVIFSALSYLYVFSESTLCNNYLMTDQKTVGYGFMFLAVSILIYVLLMLFTDQRQYFEQDSG